MREGEPLCGGTWGERRTAMNQWAGANRRLTMPHPERNKAAHLPLCGNAPSARCRSALHLSGSSIENMIDLRYQRPWSERSYPPGVFNGTHQVCQMPFYTRTWRSHYGNI